MNSEKLRKAQARALSIPEDEKEEKSLFKLTFAWLRFSICLSMPDKMKRMEKEINI